MADSKGPSDKEILRGLKPGDVDLPPAIQEGRSAFQKPGDQQDLPDRTQQATDVPPIDVRDRDARGEGGPEIDVIQSAEPETMEEIWRRMLTEMERHTELLEIMSGQ